MIKKIVNLFILIVLSLNIFSQETISLMQYNLLNYGHNTSYCDQANNNIDDKTDNIRTITDYILPDILVVNEMDNDETDVIQLLGSALNSNGRTYYKKGSILNQQNSSTINMLYYNSDILSLVEQYSVSTWPRDINIYKMNYSENGNDIDFYVAVAHLKAGNQSYDESTRADMTEDFMNYLTSFSLTDNWIFAGDLNLYSPNEPAFQNLINPIEGIRFLDPVNQIGEWHNNPSFSMYHTQSTHSSSNGCASYGGMDDRFDFILINDAVKSGNYGMEYVDYSYTTLGQDGNHYNDAVNYGTNNSAPAEIIDALYETSDHLPVIAEFDIAGGSGIADISGSNGLKIKNISSSSSSFSFDMIQSSVSSGKIEVLSLTGKKMNEVKYPAYKEQHIKIRCDQMGMFLVRILSDSGNTNVFRVVLF